MSREARLGLFIFTALILFAVGIFLIGKGRFLFSDTYVLNANFETVSGLVPGAEVRMGGVRVGAVSAIELPSQPGGKIVVRMEMDGATSRLIRKDSIASIQTEGLLGSKFVQVTFGSAGAGPVQAGESIAAGRSPDLSDIMAKTSDVLDTTNSALRNIEAATLHIKDITEKVDSGQGTFGKLLNSNDIYRELRNTSSEMADTASQAKAGAAGFRENMEALKHNWLVRGFFKKRGYMDEAELTRHQIDKIPQGETSKKFVVDAEKLFDSDSAELENKKKLNEIGKYLESNPYSLAVVAAYSDMRGDGEEEMKLSQARALAVRDYLVDNFRIDDERVKTRGLGKRKTAAIQPQEGIEVLVYPAETGNSVAAQ